MTNQKIHLHEIHVNNIAITPRTAPYDLAEIKKLGEQVLNLEVEDFLERQGQSPHPKLFLFPKTGGSVLIVIDGAAMNCASAKSDLAHKLRELIEKHDALATAFLYDTYIGEPVSPEAEKMRRLLGLSLVEGAKYGLVKDLREVLALTIESPLGCTMLRQFYKRTKTKIVIEERSEINSTHLLGKFSFFAQQKEAHA